MWARTRRGTTARGLSRKRAWARRGNIPRLFIASAINSWETFPLALAPVSSVCINMHTLDTYSPPLRSALVASDSVESGDQGFFAE